MDTYTPSDIHASVGQLISNIRTVISIDQKKLEYLVAAYMAGGHVLLADSHGVGKTSLARALAGSIVWDRDRSTAPIDMDDFNRVQCTVDLLPQDIIGYNRITADGTTLSFNRGPIFSHFVLCDEINLLTPKTQGSFFQAMEEQEVSVEGQTYPLTDPFFIIATMNLKGAHLFPLPAPQLDRFMVQLSMGYPQEEDEARIVRQHGQTDSWNRFRPVVRWEEVRAWKQAVDDVYIHDEIISYIVSCVRETRAHSDVAVGASPRTGVKISRLARSLALLRGQDFVTIDLVKEIFPAAVTHRLVMKNAAGKAEDVIRDVLTNVSAEGIPVR
ncbi:MAG: MoxR family ATPase [Spirochaetaceae bacterium]|nr:MAG: MoxR family ATPase [Spirochaetaceae bacterium]